ncbi:FRG domain-containing protein [Flavobacteriaceae bacterium M23B6Z8]
MHHTVNSIAELIEFVKEVFTETKRQWWFRGHADVSWKLTPSLWRDYNKQEESYMTQEFLFKAKSRSNNNLTLDDRTGWISLMQHHGLPTRLLDWSKSPLIGLYFATYNYHRHSLNPDENDACLWMLCPGELNLYFDFEDLVYPLNSNTALKLINQAFYTDRKNNLGILAASAIETHGRMIMQQSAFTIHSDTTPLEKIDDNRKWLRKIIIPQEKLKDLAIELEIMGIRLSSIFPDLDNLSKEIKHYHLK